MAFTTNRNSGLDDFKRARTMLLKAHSPSHDITNVYEDTLRALRHVFGGLVYKDSENKVIKISNIHANPERAIAKILQQENTILPITSISQEVTEGDDMRQRYGPLLVSEKYWDKSADRAIRVLSFPPRPININYSLNVWSKYVTDIDQISEQIRLLFNPDLQLNTKDNTRVKAFLIEESNESNFGAGDGSDRLVRRLYSISVETYVNSPKYLYTSTGKIEEFVFDVDIHKYLP